MLGRAFRSLSTRVRTLPGPNPALSAFLRREADGADLPTRVDLGAATELPPYMESESNAGRSVFVETHGCQMNESDSEVVLAIMLKAGFKRADTEDEADVVLINTCSIREKAELKIWSRLGDLRQKKLTTHPNLTVGVLGCMAERLKSTLLEGEKKMVDLVVGPDAYKTLPQLLQVVGLNNERQAINTMLSADETYADVAPVRTSSNKVSAFVTIMRGCDSMCSFCVVPQVRGRERSRPMESILREVAQLSEQGYKEVTLLGQNVNVYNDLGTGNNAAAEQFELTPGFKSNVRIPGGGADFCTLIERVAAIDRSMRIRFTSPHPKAFPLKLLNLIASTPNICKSLHVPAQSGSSSVLQRMRRHYDREAYLNLIDAIRNVIPGATISTDMISGFCGETEEEHQDTLSLMRNVKFDFAFMFAYSLREKTHAHRAMVDDVPAEVKNRRLREVIETFHSVLDEKIQAEVGTEKVVLVEGVSKRSQTELVGRSDANQRVVFRGGKFKPGDYATVKIEAANPVTLRGVAVDKQ